MRSISGQFENGVANGIATIAFAQNGKAATGSAEPSTSTCNFEKFEGMVKAGRMHGIGKVTYRDGTEREGSWVDNKLQEAPSAPHLNNSA